MAHSIFINYRRSDTSSDAGRIHDILEQKFGSDSVFLDVDDIEIGSKWKQVLEDAGLDAKVLLVLIGDQWLTPQSDGTARLFNEGDWVRQEIELALEKNLTVIPVLLKGAKLPQTSQLPPSIQGLLDHQSIELRNDRWKDDIQFLCKKTCNLVYSKPRCLLNFYWKYVLGVAISIALGAFAYQMIFAEKIAIPTPEIKPDEKPCVAFTKPSSLKALIFPILSDNSNSSTWQGILDNALKNKCEPSIQTEIRFASESTKQKSSAEKKDISLTCGADIYIGGTEYNGILTLDYGFTDQKFDQLIVDEALDLNNTSIDISDFNKNLNQSYDEVVCLILGLYQYKKHNYTEAIDNLKKCQTENSPKIINEFIADSYYKLNQYDSSLVYIERISIAFQDSSSLQLKKASIAEKAGKSEIAVNAYSKALETEKTEIRKAKILEKRGDQYQKLNELNKSKEDYTKSKVIKPNTSVDQKINILDQKISNKKYQLNPSVLEKKISIKKINTQ